MDLVEKRRVVVVVWSMIALALDGLAFYGCIGSFDRMIHEVLEGHHCVSLHVWGPELGRFTSGLPGQFGDYNTR